MESRADNAPKRLPLRSCCSRSARSGRAIRRHPAHDEPLRGKQCAGEMLPDETVADAERVATNQRQRLEIVRCVDELAASRVCRAAHVWSVAGA
jgi:hypothetical protein